MNFKGWRTYQFHFGWPYYCGPGGLSFVQKCSVLGEGVEDIPIDNYNEGLAMQMHCEQATGPRKSLRQAKRIGLLTPYHGASALVAFP